MSRLANGRHQIPRLRLVMLVCNVVSYLTVGIFVFWIMRDRSFDSAFVVVKLDLGFNPRGLREYIQQNPGSLARRAEPRRRTRSSSCGYSLLEWRRTHWCSRLRCRRSTCSASLALALRIADCGLGFAARFVRGSAVARAYSFHNLATGTLSGRRRYTLAALADVSGQAAAFWEIRATSWHSNTACLRAESALPDEYRVRRTNRAYARGWNPF